MPMGGRLGGLVRQTYNEIVVSGGWRLEDGELVIDPQTWGYARVARDGHAEAGWEHRADQPVAVANPAYAKTGQSHLVIVGGDMSGGSPEAFFAGTKPVEPVPGIWAFHVPTDTWNQLGELPQGQAGGLLGQLDGETYLLTGSIDNQSRSVDPLHIAFSRTTKPMQPLDWAIIIMYFAVVAAIGAWFARKQSSMETFALGGRKVKWWAAAISMFATGVSTISYMALPALFACIGLVQLGGTVFILPGILVSAYLTYPLLRRLNITSTYEFLERRFGTALRLIGSFVGIMIQLLSRIGIVVMLPALAISSMTGMDPRTAILLTGIVTTIYSAAGGFEAVVWTDVTQGLLMMAGFIALGVLAFMNIDGGFGAFLEFGTELERFNLFIFKFDMTVHMIWFAFLGQIIMLMSFASEQTTAQRVLSTPMKDVRKLAWMFGVFAFLVALVVAFVGMGIFGFFKSQPEFLNPVMKNEQLVPIFILNKVPVGLAGLLIATMFAAAMSTISSSVNSSAVMFAEDFYKRLRKNVSNKEEMRVMQIATVFSGVVGTGLALWLLSQPLPTLWEGFTRIMALVGGGFVGVFALGMFTRRANELGAIIGVIASFLAAYYSQQISMDIHYAGLAVITKGVCIIVGYCVSLLIPSKPRDLTGLTIWDQVSDEEAEARIQAIEQASANSQQER
jgi:SSS family solute:Na+ symporter